MSAHVTVVDTTRRADELVNKVSSAFQDALKAHGKLEEPVLSINGMSGRKYRLFINNLIGGMTNPRYLEVGVWAGSTLCSAISKNTVSALAIDNLSEFGGPSDQFYAN